MMLSLKPRLVFFALALVVGLVHSDRLVENGVVTSNGDQYLVQCDPGHVLNSNSSRIVRVDDDQSSWIPVNGLIVSHLPLCASKSKH